MRNLSPLNANSPKKETGGGGTPRGPAPPNWGGSPTSQAGPRPKNEAPPNSAIERRCTTSARLRGETCAPTSGRSFEVAGVTSPGTTPKERKVNHRATEIVSYAEEA